MRKFILVVLLCLASLTLSSCYDANEVEELLHVLVIGIDRGVSDKWRLSLQLLIVGESQDQQMPMEEEDSQEGESDDLITIDAPSFFTAINMLNTFRSRKLVFTHSLLIVLSEDIAKSELFEEYVQPLNRFSEIRRSAHMIVVKGSVEDFLKENKAIMGELISDEIRLLLDESKEHGLFPLVTFEQFNTALKSNYQQPITILAAVNTGEELQEEGEKWDTQFKTGGAYVAGQLPRAGMVKVEFLGTAVFKEDRLVGELTGDETRFMLMCRGEFRRAFFTIPDPKEPEVIIPLDVRTTTKPEVSVKIEETGPHIKLKIKLDLDLLAIQSRIKYEQPDQKSFLEEVFAEIVKEGVEAVLERARNLETDIFLFGDYAARNFWTIPEFEKYNWNEQFKHATFDVEVETVIRRTGRQLRLK